MYKFLTIFYLCAGLNHVYTANTSALLVHAKDKFDQKIISTLDNMEKMFTDVQILRSDVQGAAYQMTYTLSSFTVPSKYRTYSNGRVSDFRTLGTYYRLNSCYNHKVLNEALSSMDEIFNKTEILVKHIDYGNTIDNKVSENDRIYESLFMVKEVGDRCANEVKVSDHLTCLKSAQDVFDKVMKAPLSRYKSNHEEMKNILTKTLQEINNYTNKYIEPAAKAYNIALIEINKCLKQRNINVLEVKGDTSRNQI